MAGENDAAVNVWASEKLRAAGFTSAQAFSDEFSLKPYRLAQLYRAATKKSSSRTPVR